nr:hypothetical protein [Thioalkalivibrio sp.]
MNRKADQAQMPFSRFRSETIQTTCPILISTTGKRVIPSSRKEIGETAENGPVTLEFSHDHQMIRCGGDPIPGRFKRSNINEDTSMKEMTRKTLPIAFAAAAVLAILGGPAAAQTNFNTTIQEGHINTNDSFQRGTLNDNATYQEGKDNANRTRQRGDQNWNQTGQFGRYNYNETRQQGFSNRTSLTRGRGRD